jgi:ABC-2 type transport system permease protein
MFDRIIAIARKEFYQIWRDKRSLGLLAFVPTFTLLLFGYALTLDTKHIKLMVVDDARTSESREYIGTFTHTEYFDLAGYVATTTEAQRMIEKGAADVVMVIPRDFSRLLLDGRQVDVQALVNGGNSNVATAAASYVNLFTQDFSKKIRTQTLMSQGVKGYMPIDYRPRIWFNPQLVTAKYLVPGLMGYVMMIATVLSTSLSIVREKERGTMEQIMVSPVRSREFMIGKVIPYFIVACILAFGIIVAGWLLFDIPVQGSIPMLAVSLLFFITGGLGMGLAISTIAATQESAFFIAVFTTVLPTQLLSGFIFPIENMPRALQIFTTIVPAKYLLIVLRSILLKGAPLATYWEAFVALVLYAVIMMSIAILRMKKRV